MEYRRCPDKLRRPTFRELYDRPKLIMNCLGTINVTIDVEEHFLHNHSIYCAIRWKDLKGINNKSISSSIKKFCKHTRTEKEALSSEVDLLYLLGVLNSSMLVNCRLTNEAEIITSTSSIYATSLFRLRLPSSKRR